MKLVYCPRNYVVLAVVFIVTSPAYAESFDYEKDLKILAQRHFCAGRSENSDMNVYNECILVIENRSHKCDKVTKPEYEKIMEKYSDYDKGISEFMEEFEPVVKKYFACLDTLY